MNSEPRIHNSMLNELTVLHNLHQLVRDIVLYWDIPATEVSAKGWLDAMQRAVREVFHDAGVVNDESAFTENEILRDARNCCMSLVTILHTNAGMSRREYGSDVPNEVAKLRMYSLKFSEMLHSVQEALLKPTDVQKEGETSPKLPISKSALARMIVRPDGKHIDPGTITNWLKKGLQVAVVRGTDGSEMLDKDVAIAWVKAYPEYVKRGYQVSS